MIAASEWPRDPFLRKVGAPDLDRVGGVLVDHEGLDLCVRHPFDQGCRVQRKRSVVLPRQVCQRGRPLVCRGLSMAAVPVVTAAVREGCDRACEVGCCGARGGPCRHRDWPKGGGAYRLFGGVVV
ncbi:hypothetical protein N9L68_06945 [bacterium]|nr:hypothetical protein [bacterium]